VCDIEYFSQARAIKIRCDGESLSETENSFASQREYASQSRARELSIELSQWLAEQNLRTSQVHRVRVEYRAFAAA